MTFNFQCGDTALNGICPYFTMFPLDFPLNILKRKARAGDVVLDPFCGRGTTNFAARLVGLRSLGVDSSPVAVAITAAKLVSVTAESILAEASTILHGREACHIPKGTFWRWAFHKSVLQALCKFREAFLADCTTDARIALRGLILGALHGPKQRNIQSYFSNQCPRTYAPKPTYAIGFWRERKLIPQAVDVMDVIARRAKRYYDTRIRNPLAIVRLADSRKPESFEKEISAFQFNWVITSPPYFGMQTYIPDQWLRNWFVGGPDVVEYRNPSQLVHSNPDSFVKDLHCVWRNVGNICCKNAKMVIRFGGIPNKDFNPLELLQLSLKNSGWKCITIKKAGFASNGKRQADSFLRVRSLAIQEYDVWMLKE